MNTAPLTVRREMSAARVHRTFVTLGMRHLCVTDHRNRIVGIVTRKDLDAAAGHGAWRRAALHDDAAPRSPRRRWPRWMGGPRSSSPAEAAPCAHGGTSKNGLQPALSTLPEDALYVRVEDGGARASNGHAPPNGAGLQAASPSDGRSSGGSPS